MKIHNSDNPELERWRRRFQQSGCPVADALNHCALNGLRIEFVDEVPLYSHVTVWGRGKVRYALLLRITSDSPHRVLHGFTIETDLESVRVLEPLERVPQDEVDWDVDAKILNNQLGHAIGSTLVREGLLLGEGLKSPVKSGKKWVRLTVSVEDQFGQWYSEVLSVPVLYLEQPAKQNRPARTSVFDEPVEEEAPRSPYVPDPKTARVARTPAIHEGGMKKP